MTDLFYAGDGTRRSTENWARLPQSRDRRLDDPEHYRADPGLVDAVNVALLLRQPLLLTGEPGTGKTQLASSLAWELGLDEPLKFETKSTSVARDLFYSFDALGRFQAARGGATDPRAYLHYNALGAAILRSNEEAKVADYFPPDFVHGGRRRSVVLIDEVDKAPRDFPNDILNELEHLYFRIPELGGIRLSVDPEVQPIVILTSNSEKDLPDAFLRRCIYYDIPPPLRPSLVDIVTRRLGRYAGGSSRFLDEALDLFEELRKPASGLRKKPSTAELLSWLIALRGRANGSENPLADQPKLALGALAVLVKGSDDRAQAIKTVQRWIEKRK